MSHSPKKKKRKRQEKELKEKERQEQEKSEVETATESKSQIGKSNARVVSWWHCSCLICLTFLTFLTFGSEFFLIECVGRLWFTLCTWK